MRSKCSSNEDTINDFIPDESNEVHYDSDSDIEFWPDDEEEDDSIGEDSSEESDEEVIQKFCNFVSYNEEEPSDEYYIVGTFLVSKSDFVGDGDPPIWKVIGNDSSRRYNVIRYDPFYEEEKLLYKRSTLSTGWVFLKRTLCYIAPVTDVERDNVGNELIVEFHKNLVQQDGASEQSQQQV